MKLIKIYNKKITVEVKTGLSIGGSADTIKIGGIDNSVVKLPYFKKYGMELYDVPYIPGSSLKGKMRSLLELTKANGFKQKEKKGKKIDEFEMVGNIVDVDKTFGAPNLAEPVRFRFEDLMPTEDTIKLWEEQLGGMYVEDKAENSIDRITSKASNPRHTERVIPGSVFEGNISIKLFDTDVSKDIEGLLKDGVKLINGDYLGGSGSRGYGRVIVTLSEDDDVVFGEE